MAASGQRDIKWIDGLRGVASVIVVTAHICRSLAPYYLAPAMAETGPFALFQLPFFRLFLMGRPSIAIFAILTGYVAAMKPIKQARAGMTDQALSNIAKTAFRRTGRFVFPSMIATTIAWLWCELGAFRIAMHAESDWIRDTSPVPSSSFAGAFWGLFDNLLSTWISGRNRYDPIQWTLTYLLRGSMITYLTLFATIYVKPRSRMLILCGLYMFMYMSQDALIGIHIFTGILLVELNSDPSIQEYAAEHPILRNLTSYIFIVLGLFFCSYPEDNFEWASWSRYLNKLGMVIFPADSELSRFFPGIGADLVLLGIVFSPVVQGLLSHSLLTFLGRLSWPVYLIHGPLMRTVLTWMLYGVSVPEQIHGKDIDGHDLPPIRLQLANRWICLFAIPLFYLFLYRVAQFWVLYVEPWCGRATWWLEDCLFQDDAKMEKPLLLC